MEQADALRLVERAQFEVNVIDGSLTIAMDRLKQCVRVAHRLGVPQVDLARAAECHRNTIRTWCSQSDPLSELPDKEIA